MPFNLVLAFVKNKNAFFVRKYLRLYSLLIIVLMAITLIYTGMINYSLYPLLALLSYRSWMLSRADKKMLKP
jgi:hypothetical protein